MIFKKGDIVSFIDEKLEGVVRHVDHNGNIHVETSDGFDLQVSPKEIVKTGELKTESTTSDDSGATTELTENEKNNSGLPDIEGVYFLTEAYETNKVLTGKIRLLFVNATKGDVYFSIHKSEGQPFKIMHGHLSGESSLVLAEYMREDWLNNQHFHIQCIVNDQKSFVPSIREDITVKMPGLNDVIDTKDGRTIYAIKRSIYKKSNEKEADLSDLLHKYKIDKLKPLESGTRNRSGNLKNKTNYDRVVDLHIEELVDQLDNLSSDAMLHIQVTHFENELNKAISDNCYKITFIHGVGKGILKKRIREELKKYPDCKLGDADALTFGSGATEVILR
jgi:hypothetical protein